MSETKEVTVVSEDEEAEKPRRPRARKPPAAKPADEGAPKTETPEDAKAPEGSPRDDDPPMETPEEPVEGPVTVAYSHEEPPPVDLTFDEEVVRGFRTEYLQEGDWPESAEDDEVTQLHLHVSSHPVDAHAPAWPGREPNSP